MIAWHVYNGAMVEKRKRIARNRFITHWREIDPRAWISSAERLPTRADADQYNCVISRNRWGEVSIAGWHRFQREPALTHWQHPPPPPKPSTESGDNDKEDLN